MRRSSIPARTCRYRAPSHPEPGFECRAWHSQPGSGCEGALYRQVRAGPILKPDSPRMKPVVIRRRARLAEAMARARLDVLVLYGNAWQNDYLRYATDF